MGVRMFKRVLVLFLSLPVLSTTMAANLCKSEQQMIQQCSFGKKSVSVCTASEDTITYRFGTPEKIEMEIESPVTKYHEGYSGGGAGYLLFENGPYGYTVFSRSMRGERLEDGSYEHLTEAGIIVSKGKNVIAELDCVKGDMTFGEGKLPDYEPIDTLPFF